MADFLQELNHADFDWMAQAGRQIHLKVGQTLLEADQPIETLFIVLDGRLDLRLPAAGNNPEATIGQLIRGGLTGALLPGSQTLPYRLQAATPALVLAVPQPELLARSRRDREFEARLFRSIALILARQHSQFVATFSQQGLMPTLFVPKSIFSVFGSLQDGDLCWMLGAGTVQRLEADTVCLARDKPLEALYITLQGSLAVGMGDQNSRPLVLAVGQSRSHTSTELASTERTLAERTSTERTLPDRAVSQILPGELVGLSQFLDFGQNRYTIRANQDALVLTLPLPVLQWKMQQDCGFAARFHQAAAHLMAERTTQLFGALSYEDRCYECGDSLCTDHSYDDEVDMADLQQASLARARFSWMLKQLNIKD